jgi:hypothetical protein
MGKQLQLSPQVATSAELTHAALVTSTASQSGSFTFAGQAETLKQLRTGSAPNPWEVAWFFWGYSDDTHFYAFTLQTNGWVLSKEDPLYPGNQRFLDSGAYPFDPLRVPYTFRVDVNGAAHTMNVYIKGALVTSFTDSERPYTSGKIGMYCEDATVRFDNITGAITDNFDGYSVQSFSDGATFGSWTSVYNGFGTNSIVSVDRNHGQLGFHNKQVI